MDWVEIKDKYGVECNQDTIRKASSTIFGGTFRNQYFKNNTNSDNDDLDVKLASIRKERMKLQTLNLERTRIERNEARHELYYEYIGEVCETLPFPDFQPCYHPDENDMDYILTISDIHYGAAFTSINNSYSPTIAKQRFEKLLGECGKFINTHKVNKINVVCLGDDIQGLLRVNDLKINDSSVVKATVEVSRLIASFLNQLSALCNVDYYHVPSANHSQTRNLGTKASELADEDLEYIIGHYIQDLCVANDRVNIYLADEGDQYININIFDFNVLAGHGHTIKNVNTAIRDLSVLRRNNIDYLLLGHFHGGKSFTVNESDCSDTEVIIAPSFIGSDPYSDSIMKGSKAAALICGFDEQYGHTETYKIILN